MYENTGPPIREISSIIDFSEQLVTPESLKTDDSPAKIYLYTNKYGETETTLSRGFESKAEKIEGEYSIAVPEAVMDICEEVKSLGGRALLVGGCVRDAIISAEVEGFDLEPKDFDIEIYGLDAQTLRLVLETKFGEINAHGQAFAVLKVPVEGLSDDIDASIPRRESKTGAGHKGFEIQGDPSMTVKEAAKRRDLTINTLAYDPLTETVYDSYGGVEDIKNRVIEVTNNEAFQEDPLRVLRIMQFASRFEFEISDNAIELCKQMVERGDLDSLPADRVTTEMEKLLTKGRKPSIGLEFAREVGIVKRYWPELQALVDARVGMPQDNWERAEAAFLEGALEEMPKEGVPQEDEWHPEGDAWRHTLEVVNAAVEVADREIAAGRFLGKEQEKGLKASVASLTENEMRENGGKEYSAVFARLYASKKKAAIKEKKLVLALAALGHDFGKAVKTEYVVEIPEEGAEGDTVLGRWKSHGHEPAGVAPTKEFLERFKFPNKVVEQVLTLVPDHMTPKTLWMTEQGMVHDDEKIDMSKSMARLSKRLAKGSTDIYTLSLLAESDQRGRNPDRSTLNPLPREKVAQLEEWQSWFIEKANSLGVSEKPPEPLIKGRDLITSTVAKEALLRPGPWVGTVLRAVELDQIDGNVKDREAALASGIDYLGLFLKVTARIAQEEQLEEADVWKRLSRLKDPRSIF